MKKPASLFRMRPGEVVTDVDRRYFERYPNKTHYVRNYVEGELGPGALPHGTLVLVQQIAPGIRYRRTFDPMDTAHERAN